MAKKSPSEHKIMNDILLDMSSWGETLVFRNNTGMAWQGEKLRLAPGETVKVEPRMVILRNARPIHFGLEGSGDIMGVSHGKPVAVEVKKDNESKQRKTQGNFEIAWEKAGGLYILTRSVEETRTLFFNALLS